MAEYANLMEWVVTKDGPVATVKFDTVNKPLDEFIEHHVSLALALEKVRFDDTVRVVILTGRDDGLFELGPSWTARQMADLGLINYAVPADQLDAKVAEFVGRFLERPIGPLIRTKRAANKRLIEQMNLTLDYSWLSESIDLWEMAATGFEPQLTLRPDDPSWTVEDPGAAPGLDPQHGR